MFSLCINTAVVPDIDAFESSELTLANGWIRKLNNPHLSMAHRFQEKRLEVWIGEIDDPHADSVEAPADYSVLEVFEGVKISVDWNRIPARIELVRTADGSTPLHLSCEGGVFRATWDFEEIAFALKRPEPDIDACRRYLENGPTLTRSQVLKGIYNLWPGEAAWCDGVSIEFQEQRRREVAVSSFLANDVVATDEFLRLIGESVAHAVTRSGGVLLEVSGGLDSSLTAVAAAALREDLNSYGLVHEGAVGTQQRNRRQELIRLLSLRDHECPSNAISPIAALRYEECLYTPMDDNHRLACALGIDGHPDRSRLDMVITGIGGDELSKERTYIRQDFEVAGRISSSAALASVGRGDIFLRRGIWPRNPLATHSVVDFCRRLPQPMRMGRMLHTLTLARAGLSDGFLFPRYGENFSQVLIREAALTDFDAEVGESILADYGVNVFDTLHDARIEAGQDFTTGQAVKLWYLIKLERILKKYVAGERRGLKIIAAEPHSS